MPRIPPNSTRPVDIEEIASEVERQEVAQASEETQAATSEQSSFYAGEVVSDAELRPHLRALRLQVPRMANLRATEVLTRGFNPSMLQSAELTALREAYAYFHDHYPTTALAHDLELAWVGSVEQTLGASRDLLLQLQVKAQELNRGVINPQQFFAAWDDGCAKLRRASNAQLDDAKAHAPMAPHETFFYRQVLAALDEYALPVASAKAHFQAPSERILRNLAQRLSNVAQFSSLDNYVANATNHQ